MYSNRVTLTGFIGQNAEVKTTRNNTSYTGLALATKRSWRDRDHVWQSETTWHRCIVWGKLGEFAATLLKGTHVQIEGELRQREYAPRNGEPGAARKSITEVRVTSIVKLDRPQKFGAETQAEGAA
jgi:single-strand DNA-binding protein